MTSQRLRRNRRIFTVIPTAAIAAVLSVTAVAYACAETYGTVNLSVTSLEPGDAFVVSGTSVPRLNNQFRLKLSHSATECLHGTNFLGGSVTAAIVSADQPHAAGPNGHQHGDIASVTRLLPTNITSGVRYLCWSLSFDIDTASNPRAVTIV